MEQLRSSDRELRDQAAREIWRLYSHRLRLLVRRRLDDRIRRREDEDDVLQSMYASFFTGQIQGFAMPANHRELWRLLVRITVCKLINTAKHHTAARRDVRRESHLQPGPRPPSNVSTVPHPSQTNTWR